MGLETNYFWLNCGYNRFNHNEPLEGQTTTFESGAHFNPSQGYRAFKQAQVGDKVIFYQVQTNACLLGCGEITRVETGASNKTHVQFKFNESFYRISADYLKRSERLEFRINNMKETLFNKISKEEFDIIYGLGSGQLQIPKYYFLSETDDFTSGEKYTIYTHTINGIKRNGYYNYTQLEIGNKVIFYNKFANQSVIGTGEVSAHIHDKPPIQGRTNSTAIEVIYEQDIEPISLFALNKHPKLKNLYFLQENAKQAIASLTKSQYNAILEMSENGGLKENFSQVSQRQAFANDNDDQLKPFILLMVDKKEEGLKASETLLQKTKANPVFTTGHKDFSEEMLYGCYLPNETGALYYRKGFITKLMPRTDRSFLVIDQFDRIDPEIFQTYINVLEGYEMTLPRYDKTGKMVKWSKQKDSFYHFNPNWHIIGVTYDSADTIKSKYSEQFLKYTRIIKVNH
ncbi:EVE domain-containing protein [Staphylococcus massiliensis]|uniref:EVE domain-containing protein n=1 Tax=Staphylococcus massiliensis TaxID=555791 RepID=UPI001EDD631C|nr:EVE domain-containing protein [Staphylococcus massiliensis]MCG3402773.1 EVE domain-containing protein [Staphylococcus massiliensis]